MSTPSEMDSEADNLVTNVLIDVPVDEGAAGGYPSISPNAPAGPATTYPVFAAMPADAKDDVVRPKPWKRVFARADEHRAPADDAFDPVKVAPSKKASPSSTVDTVFRATICFLTLLAVALAVMAVCIIAHRAYSFQKNKVAPPAPVVAPAATVPDHAAGNSSAAQVEDQVEVSGMRPDRRPARQRQQAVSQAPGEGMAPRPNPIDNREGAVGRAGEVEVEEAITDEPGSTDAGPPANRGPTTAGAEGAPSDGDWEPVSPHGQQ
ncbi:Transmembrane protein [Plasmodiophora brassicae]